jgi:4'-phosphopantetheinyl transferase EntD
VEAIGSIKFFASDDPREARLCNARITRWTDKGYIYDAEATGIMGTVLERLTGVVKHAVKPGDATEMSEPIWGMLREHPQRSELARLLGSEELPSLAQVSLSVLEAALEGEGREEALRQELSEEELERFRAVSHPKRKLEWLAGRIAAKSAVRALLGPTAPPASAIKILSSPENAPYVSFAGENERAPLHISIAHSGETAVAVASKSLKFGIDVEEIAPSIEEIAKEFCTEEELARAVHDGGLRSLFALTTIWTAKEAARKVIGPLACSMKELVLERARAEGIYVVCELMSNAGKRVRAVTFQGMQYVYAISLAGSDS